MTAPKGRTYDCTVLDGDLLLSTLVRRAVPHMALSQCLELTPFVVHGLCKFSGCDSLVGEGSGR